MVNEQDDFAGVYRLAFGTLRMAMADYSMLRNKKQIAYHERELTDIERARMLRDLREYFASDDDAPYSLVWICTVISRDVDSVRAAVRHCDETGEGLVLLRTRTTVDHVRLIRAAGPDISNAALARRLGLHRGYVSRVRRGERRKDVA